MNHPNRSKQNRDLAGNPTPAEIKAAREKAALTQAEAADLVRGSLRAWQNWESEEAENRRMHPGLFELFLIRTGQHPSLKLSGK